MIIPHPRRLDRRPGSFTVPAQLHLVAAPGAEPAADLLAHYLGPDRPRTADGPEIRLDLSPDGPPESYRLEIEPDRITLTAPALPGLFHGVQTLRQLLPPAPRQGPLPHGAAWPCVTVEDAPALPLRGQHIDVARHFMPLAFLRELIDEIALHKLNTLHLHLTDDQGWRMEIGSRPLLTEIGAWRTDPDGSVHGGWYSQAELTELVRYAAARGVRIVPEIEMPGHVRSVLAAYPELGNHPELRQPVWNGWGVSPDVLGVHDAALDFCREVLTEVAEVFPAPMICIGGDECPTVQWEGSPAARARAAELGLADPRLLRGWLLGQMQEHVTSLGRRTMVWDETGHNPGQVPAGTVLGTWRDTRQTAEAIARGHQVLATPHTETYLDYRQSDAADETPGHPDRLLPLERVHAFDPLAGDLPVADPDVPGQVGVIGAQAQVWTEYAPTPDHVRYLLYPRLAAFAESAWSGRPAQRPGFADFERRLVPHLERLRALGALAGPGPRWTAPGPVLETMGS